ncbi:MAG TPA: ABC transporter permease subunit [Gaiellaceae bacterium]|nr:ABC transporter permease subunit [Gaiellaceae bacterium]
MLRERLQGLLMVLPPVAVVAVFIGFPVGAAIAYTLGKTGGPNSTVALFAQRQHVAKHGVTFAAYREVLGNAHVRGDLWATVWVTLVTIAVVVLLSWTIGLYVRLSDTRIARTVSALSVVPLFIPVVIASYAILTFYAAQGFIKTLAYHVGWHSFPTLGYTLWAVVIGEIWVNVPFGVLMMTSGLNSVPNALIEAARDSGASLPRTVRSVLLPMNVIPTVIVATFTGIYVLGSFTVPYLTGPSAPNLMGVSMAQFFSSFNQPQQAEVMAMIVFALAAGIGTIYVWANMRAAKRSSVTS